MRVVSGTAKGKVLKTPDGLSTRPTADRVKEAMFSIIQFDIPGASVLDLFGGTGQLGIEALSRGAKRAVFIDEQATACKLIRENLKRTDFLSSSQVMQADYKHYLQNCCEKFHIIFLDPPYFENYLENSIKLITEIDILQTNGIIVTEHPAEKPFLADFPGLTRSRDYKYGKTLVTLFHKSQEKE